MAAQKHQLPETLVDVDHEESSLGENCRRHPNHPPAVPPQPEDDDNDDEDSEGIDPADLPEFIEVDLAGVRKYFECPICMDIITETRTVMACIHRFCKTCIEKHIRDGPNKGCPICRSHCGSRRALRKDPDFDKLINVLFSDNEEDKEEIQAPFAEIQKRQPELNGSARDAEMLSWVRNGAPRSRTRHGSATGRNDNSDAQLSEPTHISHNLQVDDNKSMVDLRLISLDSNSPQLHLSFDSRLSVKTLSDFIAAKTSLEATELQVLLVKDTANLDCLMVLEGHETLADLQASYPLINGSLTLAYRRTVAAVDRRHGLRGGKRLEVSAREDRVVDSR